MNEQDLLQSWSRAWQRIIVAQLAPTGLLITTVALLQFGLADAAMPVRVAAALILLASGILGALAEYSAADEAAAIAGAMALASPETVVTARVKALAKFLPVVKFVTPAVFVAIFVALLVALFGA